MHFPDNEPPTPPTRLMAGLQPLKHTFQLSDEQVVSRWVENPYWQYFRGEEFFRHKLPIHPMQMTRWRQRIGEKGVEKLLQITIEAGKGTETITGKSFERVIVDTTVQPKAVQHLRRRSAIEPEIGHMKGDGLLGRNFLKGMQGDAINAILCGAGHNLRKILARLKALLYLLTGEARAAPQTILIQLEGTGLAPHAPEAA